MSNEVSIDQVIRLKKSIAFLEEFEGDILGYLKFAKPDGCVLKAQEYRFAISRIRELIDKVGRAFVTIRGE